MPLIKSAKKSAVGKNIATEMKAGKSQPQSIAIALSTQRASKKKKMALGGAVEGPNHTKPYDRDPGTPAPKPNNTRYPDSETMSDNWSEGNPPARKPDDQRRPKTAYIDTNDWSDGEPPSRKPFASGGEVTTKPNSPRPSQASTESAALNSKAPRQGSTPAQMAEYHEQEAAKYRMYADGGMIGEVDGRAQETQAPATPSAKPDDSRPPESEYMANHFAEGGEINEKMHAKHIDLARNYMRGGDIKSADHHYKMAAECKMAEGGPAKPKPKPDSNDYQVGEKGSPVQKFTKYVQDMIGTTEDEPKKKAQGGMIGPDKSSSIAEAIMKRRKFADGGKVDLEQNAEEHDNEMDDLNYEALRKENYSEESALEDLNSPEDSNEHSDEIPADEHDMVGKLRARMKSRRGF